MADKIKTLEELVVIEYKDRKRQRKEIYNVFARCLQFDAGSPVSTFQSGSFKKKQAPLTVSESTQSSPP